MKRIQCPLWGRFQILLILFIVIGQMALQAQEPNVENPPGGALTPTDTKQNELLTETQGKVIEVISVDRATYVHLDAGKKQFWVAVQSFNGKPGDMVLLPQTEPRTDYYSKRLKRKFDLIFFVGNLRKVEVAPPAKP